jgi:hypothetical protein
LLKKQVLGGAAVYRCGKCFPLIAGFTAHEGRSWTFSANCEAQVIEGMKTQRFNA